MISFINLDGDPVFTEARYALFSMHKAVREECAKADKMTKAAPSKKEIEAERQRRRKEIRKV
jgi:hypothetical protein